MRERVAAGWLEWSGGSTGDREDRLEGSVAHGPGHSHDKRVVVVGRNEWQKLYGLQASAWEASHHSVVMLPAQVMSQCAELPRKQGAVPFVLEDKGSPSGSLPEHNALVWKKKFSVNPTPLSA